MMFTHDLNIILSSTRLSDRQVPKMASDRVHVPSVVFYVGESDEADDVITTENRVSNGESLRRPPRVVFLDQPTTHEYTVENVDMVNENSSQMCQITPSGYKKFLGITTDKWLGIMAVICAAGLLSLMWEEVTKRVPGVKNN